MSEVTEEVTEVDELLTAHACSNKLSLSRAEIGAELVFSLPAHRAVVEGDNVSHHRAARVGVSCIVAVHPIKETKDFRK